MAVTPEKLSWTGLAVPGMYPGAQPTFEAPTVERPAGPPEDRLFGRMRYREAQTVLKTGASYAVTPNPTDEQIAAADEVFLGGRSIPLTTVEQIAALEAAGYEVQGP